MDSQTYNQLVSFIWGIANDCLVDTYDVGDYRKIILPMTVIRRFDAVLESTKDKVKAERERLKADNWKDMDSRLCTVAGEAFCNYSDYTLKQLTTITSRLSTGVSTFPIALCWTMMEALSCLLLITTLWEWSLKRLFAVLMRKRT